MVQLGLNGVGVVLSAWSSSFLPELVGTKRKKNIYLWLRLCRSIVCATSYAPFHDTIVPPIPPNIGVVLLLLLRVYRPGG